MNACFDAEFPPNRDRIRNRSRHIGRHMCFFVAVALRPGMLMLLPDLITLRIVMILTKVESIYTSFRLQDERVIQHPGGRIVTSLCKQRPPARRVDVDAELKRRGVFLVVSCSWSSRSSIVACCWRCPRSESVERANAASSLSRTRSPSSTEPRAAMTRRRVSASYCAIATVESSSTSLFTLIPRCRAISFSRPWVSSGMRMVSVDMSLFLYQFHDVVDRREAVWRATSAAKRRAMSRRSRNSLAVGASS